MKQQCNPREITERLVVSVDVNFGMAYQNQSRHDLAAGKFVEALEFGAAQNRMGRLSMQAWYMLHGS